MAQQTKTALTGRDTARLLLFVMLVLVCTLMVQALLQRTLMAHGMATWPAGNVSKLSSLPILVILLSPVWRSHAVVWFTSLRRSTLSWRIVLIGIALGVALRLAHWGGLIFLAGLNLPATGATQPEFSIGFQCSSAYLIALHLLVMGCVIPLTEELVYRAWFVTWLERYGPLAAIVGSALLFTVMHQPGSALFVFLFGILSARIYLITKSIWGPLIAHAVHNSLIAIDWYCLQLVWSPTAGGTNTQSAGAFGLLISSAMVLFSALLVSKRVIGPVPDDATSSHSNELATRSMI